MCKKTKYYTCLAVISSDNTLEEDSTLIPVSSSKIFPCQENDIKVKNTDLLIKNNIAQFDLNSEIVTLTAK